jgi:hypothetical protein
VLPGGQLHRSLGGRDRDHHHRCDPDAAIAGPEDYGPALDGEQPALHLLAGRWVASCPTCGYQLASAGSQARCERRAALRTCPVCHEMA